MLDIKKKTLNLLSKKSVCFERIDDCQENDRCWPQSLLRFRSLHTLWNTHSGRWTAQSGLLQAFATCESQGFFGWQFFCSRPAEKRARRADWWTGRSALSGSASRTPLIGWRPDGVTRFAKKIVIFKTTLISWNLYVLHSRFIGMSNLYSLALSSCSLSFSVSGWWQWMPGWLCVDELKISDCSFWISTLNLQSRYLKRFFASKPRSVRHSKEERLTWTRQVQVVQVLNLPRLLIRMDCIWPMVRCCPGGELPNSLCA